MSPIKTKTVHGVKYPADDFAYVPDPEKPSTWKLPIFDLRHVGGAEAALGDDCRGRPVLIPTAARPTVWRRIQTRKARLFAAP